MSARLQNNGKALLSEKRIPLIPDTPVRFILYVLAHCSTKLKICMLGGMLCMGIAVMSDVLVTYMLGRIVGVIVESGDQLWPVMTRELLILAAVWTLRSLGFRGREYSERRYAPELMNTTRALLFNRLINQNQAFLNSNFAGVLANHVRRGGDVISSLREKVEMNIVPLLVRFVTVGILLWQITPWFDLFLLFFFVLGVVYAVFTAPKLTRLSTDIADNASRLTGYIVDSTTNLSLVQQNVGWQEEQKRLDRAHDHYTDSYLTRARFMSWFWFSFDTVMTFFFCGFMAILAYSWQQGHVSTAQLAMAVGLVTNMFGAVAGVVTLLASKFDDIGILKEALQKISTPLSIIDTQGAVPLQMEKGAITFNNVSFSYIEDRPVFQNLNLIIPAGQKVGFVGVSGAGKTTLCQLLLRSFDVTSGAITIDGQSIANVTQDSLRSAIAVIPQDPVLFHRSLGDNIRYSRPAATDSEVRAAAKAAEALAFIESQKQGFDTLVGERGIKLSGGQRQRIAIARAIIKNARVLVLDEATSALDSETEKSIQSSMLKAMEGRTTLVIAHRLSTLKIMDRLIVMDHGNIIEDGTFDELIAKKGLFYTLWQLQAGGFLPH